MVETTTIVFVAFILDLVIGDPHYRYHPIRIIGWCITHLEEALRKLGAEGKGGGIILVLVVECIILFGYHILNTFFYHLHPLLSFAFNLYMCYSCLALGDLFNHIRPVIHSLERGDLNLARRSIAMLVGREVQILDELGVCRAAVETMAENFVDGFLSPLFWYFTGSLLLFYSSTYTVNTAISLMLIFKVASTLDSMIGHKNRRYLEFGWAGAKLDDLMNFLPARFSFFFLFFGAWLADLRPLRGIKIAFRDRLKHDSPNAAHAESFVAGALDIRLGGPTRYHEGIKDKPWLGDGEAKLGTRHVDKTVTLLRCSSWIAVITLLSAFFLLCQGSGYFRP